MATTSYGTPMGMGTQPMGMGMATSGVRNMNLPMSSARPIEVDENTPNLEEIQGFPVAGTAADGTHFHQDPITGQMYRMSTDLHQRIPQILADRKVMSGGITNVGGGVPMGTTPSVPTSTNVSTPTQTNEFVNLSMERFTSMDSLSTFSQTLGNLSSEKVLPFTMTVEDVNQTYIAPTRIDFTKDYVVGTTMGQVVIGQTTSINPLINLFNNSNSTIVEQTLESTTMTNKPINKFLLSSLGNLTSSDLTSSDITYYIPINKFYNTINLIS